MHNLEIFFGNNVKLKKNVCIAKVPSHYFKNYNKDFVTLFTLLIFYNLFFSHFSK